MNGLNPIDNFGIGILIGYFIGVACGLLCGGLNAYDKVIKRYKLYDPDIRDKILDIVDND